MFKLNYVRIKGNGAINPTLRRRRRYAPCDVSPDTPMRYRLDRCVVQTGRCGVSYSLSPSIRIFVKVKYNEEDYNFEKGSIGLLPYVDKLTKRSFILSEPNTSIKNEAENPERLYNTPCTEDSVAEESVKVS